MSATIRPTPFLERKSDWRNIIIGSSCGGIAALSLMGAGVAAYIWIRRRRIEERRRTVNRCNRFVHREMVDFGRFFEGAPAQPAPVYEMSSTYCPARSEQHEPLPVEYAATSDQHTECCNEEPVYLECVYNATVESSWV